MSKPLPASVFDTLSQALHEYYGSEWSENTTENMKFARGAQSVFELSEDVHLLGDPDVEDNQLNFNLWVDVPVDDMLMADEIAFALFMHLADEVFICTRSIEDQGVRYRFITGNGREGHQGSIHFVGPNALEFVELHRLRGGNGMQYNA